MLERRGATRSPSGIGWTTSGTTCRTVRPSGACGCHLVVMGRSGRYPARYGRLSGGSGPGAQRGGEFLTVHTFRAPSHLMPPFPIRVTDSYFAPEIS